MGIPDYLVSEDHSVTILSKMTSLVNLGLSVQLAIADRRSRSDNRSDMDVDRTVC